METDVVTTDLMKAADPEKALVLSRFFKTGKGEYGEGDLFLGISVPLQRAIARKHTHTGFRELDRLLSSPWHEARLTALLILLERFNADRNEDFRKTCADFYLSHTACINNWDLVDLTCYKLLGTWLENRDRQVLYRLAASGNLWERRIAVVTTMHFVRQGDFKDCLAISALLLNDSQDLIHKASGWLLREVGKKDKPTLCGFLERHLREMPRTMLRYAIERFPEEERRTWLKA